MKLQFRVLERGVPRALFCTLAKLALTKRRWEIDSWVNPGRILLGTPGRPFKPTGVFSLSNPTRELKLIYGRNAVASMALLRPKDCPQRDVSGFQWKRSGL